MSRGAAARLALAVLLAGPVRAQDPEPPPLVLQQCGSEEDALQLLRTGWDADLSVAGPEGDLLHLAAQNWWGALKELVKVVRAQSPEAELTAVRRHLTEVRDQANAALMLLRAGTAEDTTMTPAFQWAQSWDSVFINAKFSSRLDGPTTVLNVVDERVEITNTSLAFSGRGKDKPKRFDLRLRLNGTLDHEASTWSLASVGRVSFTLRKGTPGVWPQLLADGSPRPKNMYPWFERQEALDKEIEREQRRERLRQLLEEYEKEQGAKGEGAAEGEGTGGEAAAAAPKGGVEAGAEPPVKGTATPAGAEAAPPKKGKKRAAKGKGKAPADAPLPAWNASRLEAWLREAGFEKQVPAFRKHAMDGRALVETTEQELRDVLGLRVLGDRKRLRLGVCARHPKCTVPPNRVSDWSVEDVGEWLAEVGLAKHAGAFRRHRVDGPALLEVTEEELQGELGVRALRDRKAFRIRLCEASSDCNILPTDIAEWEADDVDRWLDEYGYAKHRRKFRSKVGDGATLLELSETDLKDELGVWPLGLRKRFGRNLCLADKKVCSAVEGMPDQYTDAANAQQ